MKKNRFLPSLSSGEIRSQLGIYGVIRVHKGSVSGAAIEIGKREPISQGCLGEASLMRPEG